MPERKQKAAKPKNPVHVDDLKPERDPRGGVFRVPEPGGPVPIPYPNVTKK
jgi:hypothetical protein